MTMKTRLDKLERQPSAGDVMVISIANGFTDDGPETVGEPGGHFHVVRGPDESRAEFIERVRVAARAAGIRTVVIGGFRDA